MIAFNTSNNALVQLRGGVAKIMDDYNISLKVASYLILIYPCKNEGNKWREYESAKKHLSKICSSEEYESAIKCLTDILKM